VLGQIYSFDHDTEQRFHSGSGRLSLQPGRAMISAFPTNPVVGMIVKYSAEENIARDVVTLDRLPVQAQYEAEAQSNAPRGQESADCLWRHGWRPGLQAGGPDAKWNAGARRLPVPPAARETSSGARIAQPAGPAATSHPAGSFDLWGNFKYCMTTGYSLFRGRARHAVRFWGFIACSHWLVRSACLLGRHRARSWQRHGQGPHRCLARPVLLACNDPWSLGGLRSAAFTILG
jgi:hypothetical protein